MRSKKDDGKKEAKNDKKLGKNEVLPSK